MGLSLIYKRHLVLLRMSFPKKEVKRKIIISPFMPQKVSAPIVTNLGTNMHSGFMNVKIWYKAMN